MSWKDDERELQQKIQDVFDAYAVEDYRISLAYRPSELDKSWEFWLIASRKQLSKEVVEELSKDFDCLNSFWGARAIDFNNLPPHDQYPFWYKIRSKKVRTDL